jgi:hypothetical protein
MVGALLCGRCSCIVGCSLRIYIRQMCNKGAHRHLDTVRVKASEMRPCFHQLHIPGLAITSRDMTEACPHNISA